MANNKDFIVKNAIEVNGPTKVTVGDAATGGSYVDDYNISKLSYDSKSADVSSQIAYAAGIAFKPDGTKMYVTSASSTGAGDVFQYSLSTAWDVSTASYDSVSYSNANISFGYGLQFKSDGTRLYVQAYEDDRVYEHTLSTAWDLSTTSATGNSLYYGSQTGTAYDFTISSDGTKIYVSDNDSPMYQYTMSTAWDISTASYDSVSFAVSGQTPDDGWYVQFNSDGTKMFGVNADDIYQYSLSTAWDLSTASYDNVSSIGGLSAITDTNNFVFKADGTKLYQSRLGNVYQYTFGSTVTTGSFDLSTGNYFTDTPSADVEYTFSNAGDVQSFQLEVTGNQAGYDLSAAAYDSKSFSVSSQETAPAGVFFKSDGTKMYVLGYSSDAVYQYSLSTAWDVSTASYDSVTFALTPTVTVPRCLVFKPDGTKFYLTDNLDDIIYQYALTTAWDLSTASYDNKNFDYSSQTVQGRGIAFKPDGTKVFLIDDTSEIVYQYSLSTAWDISTASYDSKTLDVTSEDTTPQDIAFNSDGTKLFVVGQQNDLVYQYTLSTAWDVSTGSYDSVSFSISSQETDPSSITFDTTGSKFYVLGTNSDTVYQYSSFTPITVTWDADIEWAGGTAPDSPANGEKDIYSFVTDDGGTSYIGNFTGNAFS